VEAAARDLTSNRDNRPNREDMFWVCLMAGLIFVILIGGNHRPTVPATASAPESVE
jgi:hypothetical protein